MTVYYGRKVKANEVRIIQDAHQQAGETCSTCGHGSGRHTRIVGVIPRWGWYCFGCWACPCDAMTSPPDDVKEQTRGRDS